MFVEFIRSCKAQLTSFNEQGLFAGYLANLYQFSIFPGLFVHQWNYQFKNLPYFLFVCTRSQKKKKTSGQESLTKEARPHQFHSIWLRHHVPQGDHLVRLAAAIRSQFSAKHHLLAHTYHDLAQHHLLRHRFLSRDFPLYAPPEDLGAAVPRRQLPYRHRGRQSALWYYEPDI